VNISDTLTERGKLYGKFADQAHVSQAIKDAMSIGRNWSSLSPDKREALDMIANKLGRLLNGDPEYPDNFRDIAGYALLVAEALEDAQK